MSRTRFLLLVLLGCGGAQTVAPDRSPDCATVASHLVELSERDNGGSASASLATGLQNELARTCEDDRWTPERRTCLANAQDQEATLACPKE
jgi:hypothetical protein